MKEFLPFVPRVFFTVLAVCLTALLIGFVIALKVFGEVTPVDMVGSLITVPIFSYLVHLWITMGKDW